MGWTPPDFRIQVVTTTGTDRRYNTVLFRPYTKESERALVTPTTCEGKRSWYDLGYVVMNKWGRKKEQKRGRNSKTDKKEYRNDKGKHS